MAEPDYDSKIHYEGDVSPPGLWVNDAYDLALYLAKDNDKLGILVVTMVLQFFFEDGESQKPATKGAKLEWTKKDKKDFIRDFKLAVIDVWSEKHTLNTTSTKLTFNTIDVHFDIKTIMEGYDLSDHWELTVEKADGFRGSYVKSIMGNTQLDSEDFRPKATGQRGAVHEFGHMLGLNDEYLDKDGDPESNPHWTEDNRSIMYSGEIVRPRHYTPFAAWVTNHYKSIPGFRDIVFKVNGKWDLSNAKLK